MGIEKLVGHFVYIRRENDNYRSTIHGELKKDENGYFIMDGLNYVCFCQTDVVAICRPLFIHHIVLK